MNDMWVDLAPVLFAMMISPARTLAVIILLRTPRKAVTSLAYVGGMVTAMMVQGASMGLLMRTIGLTEAAQAASLQTFIGTLFLVGGILLLVGAVRMTRPSEGGGGALATALARLEKASPKAAGSVGFGWIFASPKQWVFTLTAVSVIYAAQLQPIGAIVNYLIFAVLVQLVYLVIVAIYAVAPDRIDGLLSATFNWIKGNLRVAAISLFAGFGVIFVLKAVSILSG